MIAKRSSRALALLLALPSAAFALGLGDIRLLSPLNAPLEAEIDLVDVAPEEMNTVQAQLASRETFARYGLDWPPYLSGVQVRTVKSADGREVIKLKSNDPISDPFVTLLVEVNWARGKLVREYTMLLDPPVFTPGQSQLANAPVSAPATGAGTREGAIARNAASPPPPAATPAAAPAAAPELPPPALAVAPLAAATAEAAPMPAAQAAPAPAEPAPPPVETAPASAAAGTPAEPALPPPAPAAAATTAPAPTAAATAATAPAPLSEAAPAPETDLAETAPPAPAASRAATPAESEGTHTVRRGETLSQIAAAVAGQKANSARTQSWMLAIYQANPRAFQNNMNVLHSGAVLRMPDAGTAAAVSPAEASSEIRRQYAAWRGSTPAAPAGESVAAAEPARLKLVTPSESASAGATLGASAGESAALQGRVRQLEGQLAESKRLLEMKDAELARMQAQLAAKEAAAPPPAPAPAPPPVQQPPVVQAAPPPAPPPPAALPEEKPAPAAEAPPPIVASTPPPAARAPKPTTQPPESGGSILGTLAGYWWVLLIAALAAGGVAALRILRSRRATQFDDSLGRLAVAGAGADLDLGFDDRTPSGSAPTMGASLRGFGSADAPIRPKPAPVPEAAFLVEETGTHERPRLTPAGAAAATTARHVASDETISSETAINLDQGDPLAEADFHMAYGLYDQAADLIRIAINREPTRRDLKLKLLEVFFVWGNKDQFLQTGRELAETRAEAAPGEWEKILIMGKQLAPEDPLFSGGGAVTGAAAGGVDLDLEGGQSRVDFDLLGEPVPGEAAQGVDLDIGTAVGDHHEATTSVTDRNVALSENSFLATTGTTRQMTARVRQDTGTTETEGPTVEQPVLAGAHQATIRQKVETAMRKGASDATAELAIDDLGLDVSGIDTVDQPGLASPAASNPEAPTLVAGLDDRSRKVMEDAQRRAATEENAAIAGTGAWQFDQNELEAALTQTSAALVDPSDTARLAALRTRGVDVDLSAATGTHAAIATNLDIDVGTATGTHGNGLDLDVGTSTVPDAAFASTQRLASEELALPDLEPVTMSEVGTKLDLARAYMDMGDPDGARNILEEVLHEGSAAQKQEAQRLMESLP